MANLEVSLIVVVALSSVLVLLVGIFLLALLIVLKTRRLLCFKRNAYQRPFLYSDRELRRKNKNRNSRLPFGQKKNKKPDKAESNYRSIGRAVKFPKRDPFANKFLENPMVSMDDLNMDWTNPTFDETRAVRFEAAVVIQSWFRMARYVGIGSLVNQPTYCENLHIGSAGRVFSLHYFSLHYFARQQCQVSSMGHMLYTSLTLIAK